MRPGASWPCVGVALCALVAAVASPRAARSQGVTSDAAERVVIGASGDVLFHTRVVAAARAHGFDHLFAHLGRQIGEDEIAFANLETPLSMDRDPSRGDPPRLGAPPEAAAAMARAGLDVLSVANTHAGDQRHTRRHGPG